MDEICLNCRHWDNQHKPDSRPRVRATDINGNMMGQCKEIMFSSFHEIREVSTVPGVLYMTFTFFGGAKYFPESFGCNHFKPKERRRTL